MQQLKAMETLLPRNIPLSIARDQSEHGFLSSDTEEKYEKFSYDLVKRFAGPMPAKSFITGFLPSESPCDDEMPSDFTLLKDLFASDSTPSKERILTALVSGELA